MYGVGDLSTRDYERMLDLAAALLDRTERSESWSHIVAELVQALHGEVAMFHDNVHLQHNTGTPTAWTPSEVGRLPLQSLLRTHMHGHPLARFFAATGNLRSCCLSGLEGGVFAGQE
jgi:hypothetical protein